MCMATVESARVTALSTVPVFHSHHTATKLFALCLFVVPAVYSPLIRVRRPSEVGGGFRMYMSVELLSDPVGI
jgi:hypothetical protein